MPAAPPASRPLTLPRGIPFKSEGVFRLCCQCLQSPRACRCQRTVRSATRLAGTQSKQFPSAAAASCRRCSCRRYRRGLSALRETSQGPTIDTSPWREAPIVSRERHRSSGPVGAGLIGEPGAGPDQRTDGPARLGEGDAPSDYSRGLLWLRQQMLPCITDSRRLVAVYH